MSHDNDNELPRSRAEAKRAGSKQYFTGKQCCRGHVANRCTSDGACMECSRIDSLQRYHDNQEERNAKAKVYVRTRYAKDANYRRSRIEYAKTYREDPINNEKIKERDKEYRARPEVRDRAREYARIYQRNRCANSAKARLDRSMSGGVYKSLKEMKAGRSWEVLVGYNLSELMRHLEKLFLPGMTWDNYGRGGWHIDHKIPKVVFNYTSPEHEDFKRCWALSNLQPLWEQDNISKNAKLAKQFQPTLALEFQTTV
ncbi:hypothetical protein [Afipia felis]|nr:hypothetical protein [Afipia felis]